MAVHDSARVNTMCLASKDCAMLSYTAYDRSGSLLNSKAKSSQGHSLQAITLSLYESKLCWLDDNSVVRQRANGKLPR